MITTRSHAKPSVAWWMAGAVGAALLLSAAALTVYGRNEKGIDTALLLTGRLAFLLFLSAYAGAGLSLLLDGRFGFLRRHGREFGLAFAAVMVVHAGLVASLCAIGAPPGISVFVFFGVGLIFTYTLALFSLPALQRRVGKTWFWLLRIFGMNYIAYAFATDFLNDPTGGGVKHILFYAPFAAMSVAGFVVYAAAQLVSLRRALIAA